MDAAAQDNQLLRRLQSVRKRMFAAALRTHRDAAGVRLVAVSKTHPPDLIREAIAAGVTELAENRVQEAESKIPEVGRQVARWHLIGHLQSNKACALQRNDKN